ncbi:chorismate synthase [Dehalogenimonas etheniformans]|uniref:Chorismate synthase n=1 Tax=Dehalogenimonas etheniformans TaxID=1536648 RepID=A0A2P5P7I4_9CHLR|nr:chorismate synthase [Dehalogenimonas etheniformans]PPD58239.1 chorismate synthase [Dehalogenimonas etheniformans]QNT75648.1 chorismate synthase [Dehalogenimonas etheniformans]
MNNSLGEIFRITSFGESHGDCVGIVIDGCPAGLPVHVDEIQREADKRKSSRNRPLATGRREADKVEVFSGLFNGFTTGAPICLAIWNRDIDSSEYEKIKNVFRPGHADFTAYEKYGGFNDWRGSGRFSGRITAGFVMAGAVARKLLSTIGIEVVAHTIEIGGVKSSPPQDIASIRAAMVANEVSCADPIAAEKMIDLIKVTAKDHDSLGGVIEVRAEGLPVGLGEPVFDTLEGCLSKAYFAIPAVKGVEFGAGFSVARLKGSEDNDAFTVKNGKVITTTNNHGGILGGISSGMPLVARLAVKPTPSIGKLQRTVDLETREPTSIAVGGRHDTCIVPRAASVAESMTAIVLADFALRAGSIPRILK